MAISGYTDILSVLPGTGVTLYVSTDSPGFRVDFYRLGQRLVGPLPIANNPDIRIGQNVPAGSCPDDWSWPSYAYVIPSDWQTGIYIAMLVEVDSNGTDIPDQPLDRSTADGVDRKVMFVLKQPATAAQAILVKIPTATYAAYNYTGNGSTYRDGGNIASLRRPGCGTGGVTTFAQTGTPYQQTDVYDPSSDRMKVVHLEGPFIGWLETRGYSVDYCTDFDLHFDSALLDPYQLLVSVGHDEYWTEDMRAAVTAFLQAGSNVAFLSGNTCYKYSSFPSVWELSNNGTWAANNLSSEDSLTGVSYVHGNGRWDGPRQVVGYTLQHNDHWILGGIEGPLGDVYPDNGEQAALIGYECDGAPSSLQDGALVPKGSSTPLDFLILGNAQLDDSWEDNQDGTDACTMGIRTDGGVAFTVGTVDWARVLASGRDPRIDVLTRNVLDVLAIRKPVGWSPLGGQLTSTPVLGVNADGRLEAFSRGYDGAAHHVWQRAPSGGWSMWASEAGQLAGDGSTATRLTIGRNTDGRAQLFARFADNSIRYLIQNAPNFTWAPWVSLGGSVAGDPAVFANQDGRLEVFVRGFDTKLYHVWQLTTGGAWSGWSNEGGQLQGNLSGACNSDGRLDVFARGTDNAIWHLTQNAPNYTWAPWVSLGGSVAGDPAVFANQDGRLEVFVRGFDAKLYHAWQFTPGGAWSGWASEEGALKSDLTINRNVDGCLEVFGVGSDDAVWRIAQTEANGNWSDWTSLGGPLLGDPACAANADGRLEVFARGPQRTLWHRSQSSPGVW